MKTSPAPAPRTRRTRVGVPLRIAGLVLGASLFAAACGSDAQPQVYGEPRPEVWKPKVGFEANPPVCLPLLSVRDTKLLQGDLAEGKNWTEIQPLLIEDTALTTAYTEAMGATDDRDLIKLLRSVRGYTQRSASVAERSTSTAEYLKGMRTNPKNAEAVTAQDKLDEWAKQECGFSTLADPPKDPAG